MTATSPFDLDRTFRTIVVLIFVTLGLLVGVAVGLVIEVERRLVPLQQDTEHLSEAESQLLSALNQQITTADAARPPGSAAGSATADVTTVIAAVDLLSQQVGKNLDDLQIAQDTYVSLTHTASGGIVVLAIMLGAMFMFFHHRVLRPILMLSDRLRQLAHRDYSPESLSGIDTMLHPVFESYNKLVRRLAFLEHAHEVRQEQLEQHVKTAVRALVSQRAELARAERLAAVGEMAAKMAHEIRNPLAAIRAASGSLHEDLGHEEHRERLSLIMHEVDRLIEIVRTQLDRSRHTPEPCVETDLATLIDELTRLVDYQMPDNVSLETAVDGPLIHPLPPEGLRRSLLNLILNARQAIAGKGGHIRVSAMRADGHIRVSVEDDGPGFPDAILQQGARRFLSATSGGNGLGLSMAKRFTEELSGRFLIENKDGGGARVVMQFPHGDDHEPC